MKTTRIFCHVVLFIAFFICHNATAQISVSKTIKSQSNAQDEGIFYSLPRTVVNVSVVVNKNQRIKGPYADYAEKYLGIADIITSNSTEFQLVGIYLSTTSEADPDEYYFIKIPEKSSKGGTQTILSFSENGTIGGYKLVEDEMDELGMKYQENAKRQQIRDIFNPTITERIDTIIKRVSVDTATVEQKIFKKVSSAKTPEQKAKEAADFILKMDESKFNLINGYQEVNYEKGTMEFMYKQMDELENNYLQMFKGVIDVTSQTYTFSFIPQKESNDKAIVLCKFSKNEGILDKKEIKGEPLAIQVTNLNYTENIATAVRDRGKNEGKAVGYYYRIPDQANVAVKVANQTKTEGKFQINQYGTITFLPANTVKMVEFHEKTGSLKQIILK